MPPRLNARPNARIPAGRLAIQGGGSPGDGAGGGTPGLSSKRANSCMNSFDREPFEPVVLEPERLLRGAQIPGSRPGGLEQRQAREPLRSGRGEGDRGGSPARVPDEMEPLPAVRVRLAQYALDLDLEAVVLRRLRRCVNLEILRDRFNVRAKRGDERAVRRLCREHRPRKQNHAGCGQLGTCVTSRDAEQARARPHHGEAAVPRSREAEVMTPRRAVATVATVSTKNPC